MAEFSNIARRLFIPSHVIFHSTAAVTLFTYSFMFDGYGRIAGIVFLTCALISFPFVFHYSLKMHNGLSPTYNTLRIIVLVLIVIALSAIVYARIQIGVGAEPSPLARGSYVGKIKQVVEKRYFQEAEIRFIESSDAPAYLGLQWRDGMAHISNSLPINEGDMITFIGKPTAVDSKSCSSSPYYRLQRMKGARYLFYLDDAIVIKAPAARSFRNTMRDRVAARCDVLFNKDTASIVKALYFGNQDSIDKITINDFKRAGVLHILAASGQHVGVVVAVAFFALGLIRLNRKCMLAATVGMVGLYLFFTDMPVSLLRACVMFFVFAIQAVFDRERNIFNALFFSGVIIILIHPYELYGLGFQLSFGATFGILLFFGFYRKTLAWLPSLMANPLALTLSAQVVVIPILLAQVGELNLVGFISNCIVVPGMSLLLVVSMAAHAISIITVKAAWLGLAADTIYAINKFVVQFMSNLNGHFYVEKAEPLLYCAFCLILLPLIHVRFNKKYMTIPIVAAVAIAWVSLGSVTTDREKIEPVKHDAGMLLLVKDGNALAVIGSMPDKEQINSVIQKIGRKNCRSIDLYIPDPAYRNIAASTSIAKQLPVRRVYLSDKFKIRRHTKKFFRIIDKDQITLALFDFSAGNNFRKNTIPEVDLSNPQTMYSLYERVASDYSNAQIGFFKANKN